MFIYPPRERALCALLLMLRRRTSPQMRRRIGDRGDAVRASDQQQSSAFVDHGATSSQQLQGAVEKCVLECRLKRARVGFADSKLRRDFELGGAMNFHVHSAMFCQRRAHRL
jgi:hypothetical protein